MGIPPATFQGVAEPSDPWRGSYVLFFIFRCCGLTSSPSPNAWSTLTLRALAAAQQAKRPPAIAAPFIPLRAHKKRCFFLAVTRGHGKTTLHTYQWPGTRVPRTGSILFWCGIADLFYFYSCLRLPARDQDTARQVHGGSGRIHQQRR